jgi:hypothetical protein
MPSSSIWVLVANEHEAAICASINGASELLRSMKGEAVPSQSDCVDPGKMHDSSFSKRAFAGDLMQALCRGAVERAYDGVIIVANASMLEQLRCIRPNLVAKLLIAEIIGGPHENFGLTGLPDYTNSNPMQRCA